MSSYQSVCVKVRVCVKWFGRSPVLGQAAHEEEAKLRDVGLDHIQHTTHNTQHTQHPHTTHNIIQTTTHSTQHTVHNTQHTVHNTVQHTTQDNTQDTPGRGAAEVEGPTWPAPAGCASANGSSMGGARCKVQGGMCEV